MIVANLAGGIDISFRNDGTASVHLLAMTSLYNNYKAHRLTVGMRGGLFYAFSDIEFNPDKSINCQAYSVALFCALYKRGILRDVLSSQQDFLTIYQDFKVKNAASTLGL